MINFNLYLPYNILVKFDQLSFIIITKALHPNDLFSYYVMY